MAIHHVYMHALKPSVLFLCVIAHSECKTSPHVCENIHTLKEDAVRGEGYHILNDEPFPASTLLSHQFN